MSKRISIQHADDLTPYDAVLAVEVCLRYTIRPGEIITLSNRIAVFCNDKTKNPSFQVWRSEQ